ncbi:hypothetical protein KA005_06880 [bacterium]|nr:hypothetical protein [bacterium]
MITVKKLLLMISFLTAMQANFGYAEEKKIFACRILDTKGQELLLSDIKLRCSGMKFGQFFGAKRGESTNVQLQFSKIKTIKFNGILNQPISGHKLADVTMVTGKTLKAYIEIYWSYHKRHYNLCGIDSDTGGDTCFILDQVDTITFLHDGTFKKCPLCGTVFFNSDLERCSFDKELLEQYPKE